MFGGMGVQELLLIFLVVLLLFGAKRIPDIAQGLGKGLRDFKRAMQDTQNEINRSIETPPRKTEKQPEPPKDPGESVDQKRSSG